MWFCCILKFVFLVHVWNFGGRFWGRFSDLVLGPFYLALLNSGPAKGPVLGPLGTNLGANFWISYFSFAKKFDATCWKIVLPSGCWSRLANNWLQDCFVAPFCCDCTLEKALRSRSSSVFRAGETHIDLPRCFVWTQTKGEFWSFAIHLTCKTGGAQFKSLSTKSWKSWAATILLSELLVLGIDANKTLVQEASCTWTTESLRKSKRKQQKKLEGKDPDSNVHIFVPIWMIPDSVRHARLLASRDIPPQTKGWVEYKEGWFEIRRTEATAESTLCGMQIHYNDQYVDQFRSDEWKLIERFAQEGLLKQEVWSSRIQWLGVKAKIEIPLSGTGFTVRQNTLRIENLPESWPMDTESAWRERFCKVNFTYCRPRTSQRTFSRAMITPRPFDGRQCSTSSGPKGVLIMQIYGKMILSPNSQLEPGLRSRMSSSIASSYLLLGKPDIKCRSATLWTCYTEKETWVLQPRNSDYYTSGVIKLQKWGNRLLDWCMNYANPLAEQTATRLWLRQYVDDMQLMIHHTIAAAMQLGIRPLPDRVDPATLDGPSSVIAQALLREIPELDPRWRHDPLA